MVDTGVAQINVTENGDKFYYNCYFCTQLYLFFSGENYIIIVAGANGTLGKEDVDKAFNLLLNETSVVLLQFETPLETTEYLLKKLSMANSKCK